MMAASERELTTDLTETDAITISRETWGHNKDQSLMKHATRIQSRAIKRAGQLIDQITPSKAGGDGGGATPSARKKAAREAGLSPDQQKQAQRVARLNDLKLHKPPRFSHLDRYSIW